MPQLVTAHRDGFAPGWTAVVRQADGAAGGLAVLAMRPGDRAERSDDKEVAWVLPAGHAEAVMSGTVHVVRRANVFDPPPTVLHVPAGERIAVRARSAATEWAVVSTPSTKRFEPRLFAPHDVQSERRGDGLAQGACVRTVRLVFDRHVRPESELVVGEVVCDAGRWSSYPPHQHAQPEIYHYRFSAPQGFGHAELDDAVFKVRTHDTMCIPPATTHAQAAAPGYGMWYLWVVRHLPGAPYDGFTYDPDHTWLLDRREQGWRPAANEVRP